MNCVEAESSVSALHDGEHVPREAGEHIAGCAACRQRLVSYAEIGAEMRLLASVEQESPGEGAAAAQPPPVRRKWWGGLLETVRVPRIAVAGACTAVVILSALSAGLVYTHAQSGNGSFQYVVRSESDPGGQQTFWVHSGSQQAVFFSNGQRTIAASIEVEEIRKGVARLKVRARSYPVAVDRGTAERQLEDAPAREYTYVPLETLRLPVDGGGVLAMTGAIADEHGNLEKPLAQHSIETQVGQLMLMSPALLRGNRVLANLRGGAGTGAMRNPAIAVYAPEEGLFLFALQPFEGATMCRVILGRAECQLDGETYTLFSARPITGGEDPKIWASRVPGAAPTGGGLYWVREKQGAIAAGELSKLEAELGVR